MTPTSLKPRALAALLAAALLLSPGATPLLPDALITQAFAQDDWAVGDDGARRKEILRRYKQLVESNPQEGLAYDKMVEYAGGARGLNALIEEYQKKTADQPDALKYWLILGHLLKSRSDYEKAAEAYSQALTLQDDSAIAFLGRGQARMMLQLNVEATEDFERALALEQDKSKKQDILRKLADLSFAQRDWDKAQEYYDRLVELDPKSEYLRMEYAQVLVKYKRYDKALEQYDAILELVGRDVKARATAWRDIGELHELTGDQEKALEAYKKAQSFVKPDNWLYREVEQRVIGLYRRTDKLREYAEAREASWKRPNYDQAMTLAGLFEELGEEQKAFEYYETAVKKSSRSVDPRFKLIQILQRRGDTQNVIKAYESLIRVAPSESRYRFDLAKIHFRNGDRDQAIKQLKQVRSKFSRQPEVMVTLADTYMRFGMNDEALGVYERLVKASPRNETFILGLGEYYYQSGDTAKALEVWETILNSTLPEAQAHAQFGLVLVDHGMVERGIGQYELAAGLMPDDPEVQRGLATAYEMGRYWERAIDVWTALMRGEPDDPMVSEARSRIIALYKRQNKLRTKIKEFKRDFEKTPPDLEAGFFLAEAYTKIGEHDRAERVWLQIIESDGGVDKQDLPALQALEKVYTFRGDTDKAIGILQQLAELRPARAREYYSRIAELSLKNYDDKQAVRYAKLALEKNPDDAAAHAKLGDVYASMQRYEEAIASYKESLDLDPRAFEVYFKLAELQAEAGDLEQARQLYLYVAKRGNDELQVLESARRLIAMAEGDEDLFLLEQELAPEVFNAGGLQAAYRKVLLEIYGRLGGVLIARRNAGSRLDEAAQERLRLVGIKAYPVLMDALQSDDVGQRQVAIRMLGELDQRAASVALARLAGDEKEPLRLQAIGAVAKLGDERAAETLLGVLEEQDSSVSDATTWALGALKSDASRRALSKLVVGSGVSSTQQALAALSLGRVGGDGAERDLLKVLKRLESRGYYDQTALAVVLGLGLSGSEQSVEELAKVVQGSAEEAGVAAAWALGQIGGDEAARALLKIYWGESAELRERARRGLIWLSAGDQLDVVEASYTQMLRESRGIDERAQEEADRFDRGAIFEALSRDVVYSPMVSPSKVLIEHGDVLLEVLRERLKADPDPQPSVKASWAGDGGAVDAAMWSDLMREDLTLGLGRLSDADEAARQARHELIAGLRGVLLEALGQGGEGDRERAALVLLGQLGDARDVDLIKARYDSERALIRREAVRALGLGYLSDAGARQVLVEALKRDDSADVRAQAALALSALPSGDEATLSALLEGLTDPSMTVQVHVARALGALGAERAVSALSEGLGALPSDVLYARVKALARLDTPEAREALGPWEDHFDLRVRRAIAEGRAGR